MEPSGKAIFAAVVSRSGVDGSMPLGLGKSRTLVGRPSDAIAPSRVAMVEPEAVKIRLGCAAANSRARGNFIEGE